MATQHFCPIVAMVVGGAFPLLWGACRLVDTLWFRSRCDAVEAAVVAFHYERGKPGSGKVPPIPEQFFVSVRFGLPDGREVTARARTCEFRDGSDRPTQLTVFYDRICPERVRLDRGHVRAPAFAFGVGAVMIAGSSLLNAPC